MEPPRRPWWGSVSVTRWQIPTAGLVAIASILAILLVLALLLEAHRPRDLPPAATHATPRPIGNGQFVFTPQSGRVSLGVPYRITLLTHCGLDWPIAVDFDGSFWDPSGSVGQGTGNPPPGIGNPTDQGIITLVAPDVAEYRSRGGVIVRFNRHPGPRAAVPCS
jgi:hypothetical protein